MWRTRISGIEVRRVEEMLRPGFDPAFLYPNYDKAVLAGHPLLARPEFLDAASGRLMSSMQSWLVRAGREIILIDTGCGNGKVREHPAFRRFHMLDLPYLDNLAACGVRPEDVTLVVNTHLHVDHVGWNTRLENGRWVPTFPNAKYVFSRVDREHWDPAANPALPAVNAGVFEDSVAPVIESGQARLVEMNDRLGDNFVIEPAPGHTPGHVVFRLLDGGEEAVFTGDVMHHPIQVYRPEWSSAFCTDSRAAVRSRRRVLEHCAECAARVFPAHFGAPHVGRVRRRADGFAFDFDRGDAA